MSRMTIDGISCDIGNNKNVLELAAENHIDIPNLCYCDGLSVYGGCRLCVVETDTGSIEAACTLVPKDGMSVRTNTSRLRKHRQMILELLLASHRAECATCEKSGRCKLQLYSKRYGVGDVRFKNEYSKRPIDDSSPAIIHDPSKCILCAKCVRACSEAQNVHAIEIASRGIDSFVSCGFDRKLKDSSCVDCGLCAKICPTGALVIKNETSTMWKAIYNSRRPVAVWIEPAVAAAIGEEFNMPSEQFTMGKIISALRMLGVDYVFDGAFAEDIYIEELYKELCTKKNSGNPLIGSSCPSFVRNIEKKYPELLPCLSDCGSPMEMFAAILRRQYSDEDIFSVAVVACTARKAEALRPELVKDDEKLVDLVITTQELAGIIKESGINFAMIPDSAPDAPFDSCSGAGYLSACSGGIVEALLRRFCSDKLDARMDEIRSCGVRDIDGIRSFEFNVGEETLRLAVVSGLKNADELIADIKSKKQDFDFVEIMACPDGCLSGGGQPPTFIIRTKERSEAVYAADRAAKFRSSAENHALGLVSELLRGKENELLHVSYTDS